MVLTALQVFADGSTYGCVVTIDVCRLECSLENAHSKFFGLPAYLYVSIV